MTLLSLSNNEVTEDAAKEISAIVNNNTSLGCLILNSNHLQSIGICESVSGMRFLYILELASNCIDATAADKLAATLSECVSLKQLYLGNNNLSNT